MGLQGLGDAVEVKLVGIALPVDLGHDVLVIVVSEGAAEFVIVHVGFALPLSPAPGHLIRVRHLEFAVGAFPGDAVGVGAIGQQLQEKLHHQGRHWLVWQQVSTTFLAEEVGGVGGPAQLHATAGGVSCSL